MASYPRTICVAAVFLFILISGCVDCENDEDCVGSKRCVDGKCAGMFRPHGVGVEFLSGSPPSKIKWDEPFDIILKLTNKGSADVDVGQLTVDFFGSRYSVSGDSWPLDVPLRGAAEYEDVGAMEFKDFSGVTFKGQPPVEGIPSKLTIGATVIYEYKTYAKAGICIKGAADEDAFCTEGGDKLDKVSSAPVTVSRVTEQIFENSVDVTITVKNVGGGEVCKTGGDCGNEDDKGIVTLTKFELGAGVDNDYIASCVSTEEYIASSSKEAKFYCREIPRTAASTVEEIANITVAYKYKTDLNTQVDVFAH